jgi:Flp pilus assembly protein TadG
MKPQSESKTSPLAKSNASRFEHGQSMVELAFSLVLLLIMVAGVVDLGRAFFTFMTLRDAAQEGAVYGSLCPARPGVSDMSPEISARVRTSSNQPIDLMDTATVTVACSFIVNGTETGCTGAVTPGRDAIKVRVAYNDFQLTTPFLGALLGSQTFPLAAQVTDSILRATCP